MQTTTYRGIFVNDADTIVGIPLEEAKLIKFVKQFQRNSVRFYDLSSILSTSGGRTKMRALNVLLRQNGVQWVGAQRSGASSHLNEDVTLLPDFIGTTKTQDSTVAASNHPDDNTISFNDGCATINEKFNTFGQEQEFWHNEGHANLVPVNQYFAESKRIKDAIASSYFTKDSYISQIDNEIPEITLTDAQMAREAVRQNHRILLTCYITTARLQTPGYAYNKILPYLKLLSSAGTFMGRKIQIAILFNAKVNNVDGCGSFFQAGGTPQQALDYILTPYNLDNFKNKAGSVIVGEDLYGYRELKNLIV